MTALKPAHRAPAVKPAKPDHAAPGVDDQKMTIVPDPSRLPDVYAMIVDGDCLEPEISHGACLMFDKNAPFERGDFVVIYKRPELVLPGQHQAIVKRVALAPPSWVKFPYREHPDSDVRAIVMFEQFNPHLRFAIPCGDLLAIHKCLGPMPDDMPRVRASVADLEGPLEPKPRAKRARAIA